MVRIIAILITIMPVSPALADYHYASHEGSNEYPYTSWATAADSIQKALNAASAGDTVYVGDGTFVENIVTIDSIGLIGMGMDRTTIDGLNEDIWSVVDCGEENYFQDLHIYGRYIRYPQGNGATGIYACLVDITIRNCLFSECEDAILVYGFGDIEYCIFEDNHTNVYLFAGGVRIVNNTFNDVLPGGRQLELFDNGPGLEIRRNRFEGHTVDIWPESPAIISNNLFESCGLGISGNSHVMVENNSFIGKNTYPWGIINGGGASSTIRNNIITGLTEYAIWNDEPCTLYVHHNLLYDMPRYFRTSGGGIIDTSMGGNIYVDPMFAGSDDFELQMYSPAIDAGDPEILDLDSSRSDMGYLGGPYGWSYEYQDLPPAIPDSFHVGVGQDTIFIDWDYATEADFDHYNIYRANESGFPASPEYYYASVDTSVFKDTNWNNYQNYYYLFTAVDNQENESDPSSELAVIFISIFEPDEPFIPYKVELRQNYPNPFNPRTTIVYSVPNLGPRPAKVKIIVYNIMGEEVRNLVDEYQYYGTHSVIWDGTDDRGREVRSGVYFYNLNIWEVISITKKMVLVR
jgi:hypothetical protein